MAKRTSKGAKEEGEWEKEDPDGLDASARHHLLLFASVTSHLPRS